MLQEMITRFISILQLLPLMLSVWLGCAICGQVRTTTPSKLGGVLATSGTQQKPRLQLTTTITEQKYCSTDYLRLSLRLHYTNIGTEPLVLYKDSTVIYRQTVSADLKAAADKKYEEDVSPMVNPLGMPSPMDGAVPSGNVFVILKPGDSYDTETTAHLTFIYDGNNKARESLSAGEHLLQIKVATWYDSREFAVTLRERWRQSGFLWTDSIKSLPMQFRVEKKRSIVKC